MTAFLHRHRLILLLCLTLIGGAGRFIHLEKPSLWGDEAFTYSRVCGDFREMLDVLVYDGFPPLHYEAYWGLRQIAPLTPRVMRWIPALAGTLMIPAMYFLAAQIVRKQTALLVALFTTVSAYMMVYSRDAKMYMACWLLMTVNAGCFLWWVRGGLRVAWLAWIASGLAMVGMHLSALAVLAIEPVILLTLRPTWRRAALMLIGAVLIGSAPIGYKLGFNRWDQQIDEVGFAAGSGIGWVEQYNKDRDGPDLALFAATAHLTSWEWPPSRGQFGEKGIDRDTWHLLMCICVVLLVSLGIGLIGLRHRAQASLPGDESVSWWRARLWLALWILVPAYGVYCASMREFASPWDWIRAAGGIFTGRRLCWILLAVAVAGLGRNWRWTTTLIGWTLVGAVMVWLRVVLVQMGFRPGMPGGMQAALWPVAVRWMGGLFEARALAIGIPMLAALAWQTSGENVTSRLKRTGQMALIVAVVLAGCLGVYLVTMYRFNRQAEEMTLDHHAAPQWEMYTQRAMADHDVPVKTMALRRVREEHADLPQAQLEARANELISTRQRHWEQVLAEKQRENPSLAGKQLDRAAAERLASEKVTWERWVSMWMPRYVGMCWPAVAIATCALLMRLPSLPLRLLVFALLLATNIGQSWARIRLDTEPPFERIYADVVAVQQGASRTYLSGMTPMNIGHPGSLGITGMAGRYYLTQATGIEIHPLQFRDFRSFPRPGQPWMPWKVVLRLNEPPLRIADELKGHPEIRRIVIWEQVDPDPEDALSDRLRALLSKEWSEGSADAEFHGKYHWTWENLYHIRRREYVR